MRAIRNAVDATRRALDDPTGAYAVLVGALDSLGDQQLVTPTTWERYDPAKRKIIDAALNGESQELIERVHAAVLVADCAGGAKRRFVSSTTARISPDYYRAEALGTVRPPQSADLERTLGVAYDILPRRALTDHLHARRGLQPQAAGLEPRRLGRDGIRPPGRSTARE